MQGTSRFTDCARDKAELLHFLCITFFKPLLLRYIVLRFRRFHTYHRSSFLRWCFDSLWSSFFSDFSVVFTHDDTSLQFGALSIFHGNFFNSFASPTAIDCLHQQDFFSCFNFGRRLHCLLSEITPSNGSVFCNSTIIVSRRVQPPFQKSEIHLLLCE